MRSFQNFVTHAKDSITSTAQSTWNSYLVQGALEGLGAPIYGYASLCNTLSESAELQKALKGAAELNRNYALEGFVAQMHYDRVVHAELSALSQACRSRIMQLGLSGLDNIAYGAMHIMLIRELSRNIVQNYAYTKNIIYSASKVVPPSQYFPPAESKMEKLSAMGASTLIYTVDRYFTTLLSNMIKLYSPGLPGQSISFLLESWSYGWLLMNVKLSAAGLGNEACKKKWQDNILYMIASGASFVAATGLIYYASAMVFGGAFNYYSYDAIFNIMFDIFALISISRTAAYPGDNQVSMDLWALIKPYVDTPFTRYVLKQFLAELYSVEDLVKSKGVSQLLTACEPDIAKGLNSLKDGMKTVESINGSKLVMLVKCINYIMPGIIPKDVIKILKTMGKEYLNSTINHVEGYLDIAKTAEAKHNPTDKNDGKYLNLDVKPADQKQLLDSYEVVPILPPVKPPVHEVVLFPRKVKKDRTKTHLPQIIPMKNEAPKELLSLNVAVPAKPIAPEIPVVAPLAPAAREPEKMPTSLRQVPQIIPMKNEAPKELLSLNVPVPAKPTAPETPALAPPAPVDREEEKIPMSLKQSIIQENYFGNAPKPVVPTNDEPIKIKLNYGNNTINLFNKPNGRELPLSQPDNQVDTAVSIISGYKR